MKFLKENFMKITLSVATVIGAILFIVMLANFDSAQYGVEYNPVIGQGAGSDSFNARGALFGYIAALTFFVLATAFIIMTMFKKVKKHTKWVSLAAGVLGITFVLCAMLLPLRSDNYELMRDLQNNRRDAQITVYVQEQVINGAIAFDPANADNLRMVQGMDLDQWPEELRTAVEEGVAQASQEASDRASYQYLQNMILLFSQLVLFGILPLGFGVKLLLSRPTKD